MAVETCVAAHGSYGSVVIGLGDDDCRAFEELQEPCGHDAGDASWDIFVYDHDKLGSKALEAAFGLWLQAVPGVLSKLLALVVQGKELLCIVHGFA